MKIKRRVKNPKNKETIEERQSSKSRSEDRGNLKLSKDVNENYKKFQAFLEESTDAVFRKFRLGRSGIACALVYIDGLVDKKVVQGMILKPMMFEISELEQFSVSIDPEDAYEFVLDHVVSVADIKEAETLDDAMLSVMSGEVALMIDGFDKIIVVSARGWPTGNGRGGTRCKGRLYRDLADQYRPSKEKMQRPQHGDPDHTAGQEEQNGYRLCLYQRNYRSGPDCGTGRKTESD